MKTCDVPTCDRRVQKAQYCDAHYQRSRAGRDMDKPLRVSIPSDQLPSHCRLDDCDEAHYSATLCKLHYYRQYEGRPMEGPRRKNPRVSGVSRKTDNRGYVLVWMPEHPSSNMEGYVFEHRLVVENYLGRRLIRSENVHHRNGVKGDNRLENLEMWVSMQPAGQRITDLVAFAHEILARYGDVAGKPL